MNQPLDLLICIGAGQAEHLEQWPAAKQTLLIDANAQTCEQLKQRFANHSNIAVAQHTVAEQTGEATWVALNMPEYSALSQPTGLFDLFPGLKVLAEKPVQTIGILELLASNITSEQQHIGLVLNTPDVAESLLTAVLNSEWQNKLVYLAVVTQTSAVYGNSANHEAVLQHLQQHHYLLQWQNTEDADLPFTAFAINPLAKELQQAKAQAKKEQEALKQQLANVQAELATQAEQATKTQEQAQNTIAQLQQQLAEKPAELAPLEAKVKELTAAVEQTKKDLEDNKQWFANRKKQAEELKVQLDEANAKIQVLQGEAGKNEQFELLQKQIKVLFEQQTGLITNATNSLGKHVSKSFVEHQSDMQKYLGLYNYLEYGAEAVEFTEWSIGVDLAAELVQLIIKNNYDLVIEFGAGSSTLVMAKAMNQILKGKNSSSGLLISRTENNGKDLEHLSATKTYKENDDFDFNGIELPQRILSFEQDKAHLNAIKHKLSSTGLQRLVDLQHAPLIPAPTEITSNPNTLFYACEQQLKTVVSCLAKPHPKVLVLVDGPYSPNKDQQIRQTAFPLLLKYLVHCELHVVLDDAKRAGESVVKASWQSLCEQRGVSHEVIELETAKGATLFRVNG